MDQSVIIRAVNAELSRAESFMDSRIAHERALAYDYYYGREFGNEVEGRSRIVSCDVAQVIDSAVPAVVKIFVAGDKAVEFTPRGREDVESAEQATVCANYVFFTQNNGYALAHDFIKDGLLQKTGVFKWMWDKKKSMSEELKQGVTETEALELQAKESQGQVQIVGLTSRPDGFYDIKVRTVKEYGCVKVCVPPPEEIRISPDAMTLDVMEMPFIAHTPMLTASDLVAMGYDPEVIKTLPKGDDDPNADEKIARRDRTDSAAQLEDDSEHENYYRYDECYIRFDEDGDGVAELRKVCKVGDHILHDEPTDHIPLAIWTPKVMPHEVVGISLADDVMDIQLLKSTIWRQVLDNMYLSNAPRLFAQGDINLDDVLTVKPGGVIRGEMNSNLTPITVPFTAAAGFQMLEYADQEEEVRTGISRLFQGLDPDAINKTATGVNALIGQANARVELIARNAAEFGFKPLFKGIMYLLSKHQQQALVVRLTNKFVEVDPETWNKEYDMSCNVGLGTGTKEQQLMQLQALGMDLQAIAQTPFAPLLLDAKKVFNYVEKKAALAGFKDITVFLNDPTDPETGEVRQPEPQKPEAVQVAEVKAQGEQQKLAAEVQTEGQKLEAQTQAKERELQLEAMFRERELAMEMRFKEMEAMLDAKVKLQVGAMHAQAQAARPIQERPQ